MQRKTFLISALCFFIANNLHFISSNGFLPRALDLVATVSLGFGIFVMLTDKSGNEK